jgi:methylenetetrahydrofolate dehydrogenase (NADP+)/methenyltetrahydrofolate cyclohydrolase
VSALRLDGPGLVEDIERDVRERIAAGGVRPPLLAALAAADDPLALRFLDLKRRACERVGIVMRAVPVPASAGSARVLSAIDALNEDPAVDAIFVQAPLPPEVDLQTVFDRVAAPKDVDGCSNESARALETGDPLFAPATPAAIMRLLRHHEVAVRDARVVVVGATRVAVAVTHLLRHAGAAVERVAVDDARAAELAAGAELLIAATGIPGAVPGEWLADGAVAVDAGYDHGGDRGDLVLGDAANRIAGLVPPRGVLGPLTIALLLENTAAAWSRNAPSR